MKYLVTLRMHMQDSIWITMGDKHLVPWDIRDLISASSGWVLMNDQSTGPASALVPNLQKGIWELSQSSDSYNGYEIAHGLGTIKEALDFYENLLGDCRRYPYTELYGSVVV